MTEDKIEEDVEMKKVCILLMLALFTVSSAVVAYAGGDYENASAVINISDGEKRYEVNPAEDAGGKGWSWNAEEKTISLNGIENGSFGSYRLGQDDGPITIMLEDGTVNVFSGGLFLDGCDYIIKGNGELIIEPGSGYLYDDNGEVLTDEEGHGIVGEAPDWMSWNTNITIEGGKIRAVNRGVHLQGRLIINGGTLELGCGIYGGFQGQNYKVIVLDGKLITAFPDIKNINKYTQATGAVEFYAQGADVPMISGLEESPVSGKNGEKLVWKASSEGLILTDESGNPAKYAEFTATDCYTKTGEKADSWAVDTINTANESGILPKEAYYGFKQTDLTVNVTRVEFAALVVSLYEKITGEELSSSSAPFEDIEYYNDEFIVAKAYNAGLVSGVSETEFAPEASLTREQAATILYRIYEKLNKAQDVGAGSFADDAQISSWAKNAVYAMSEKGIIQGVGDNNFAPMNKTQKQQAIAIAMRMYEDITK